MRASILSAASQQPPMFHRWGFSGAPIRIHLSLDMVRSLQQQLQNSALDLDLISRCGLLIGDTSHPGITEILSFEPLRELDAVTAQAAIAGAGGKVVGFYRTHGTGVRSMSERDKALVEGFFRNPSSVVLLIEATPSNIREARFCFWGDGAFFDFPVMRFPFDADRLAIQELERQAVPPASPGQSLHAVPIPLSSTEEPLTAPVTAPVAVAVRQPAVRPASPEPRPPQPAPPELTEERSKGRWLIPVSAVVLAASLSTGVYLYFGRPPSPQTASPAAAAPAVKSELGLTAERRGKDLLISWNSSAPAISQANFGMLLVRGTDLTRDLPLNVEELRAGRVVYGGTPTMCGFN